MQASSTDAHETHARQGEMGGGEVPFASQISLSMLLSAHSNLANDCASTGKDINLI